MAGSSVALARVRAAFARAGYVAEADRGANGRGRQPPRLPALRTLFRDGKALDWDDAEARLGPRLLADLVALSLARRRNGALVPCALVTEFDGLLLASDLGRTRRRALHVLCPVAATRSLAAALPPSTGGPVLDLGTGSGALALLAARGGAPVLATDVNPRAVAFAARNATFNGIAGMECKHGSWFEPAAGRRFALITANIPYVIGPERLLWRDGGERAEGLLGELGRAAVDHLEPGGIACLMGNWPTVPGAPAPPVGRIAGADVLAVRLDVYSRDRYADEWSGPSSGFRADRRRAKHWRDDLVQRGIEEISWGVLYVRRRAGARGRAGLLEGYTLGPGAGEQVLGAFAGADLLRARPTLRELLATPLRVATPLGLVRRDRAAASLEVRMRTGLGLRVEVDARCREFLRALDGGENPPTPARALAPDVRAMLACGMLEAA